MTFAIVLPVHEELWATGPQHIPYPSTEELLASPKPFVELVEAARDSRMQGLRASISFSIFCIRVLGFVCSLALITALTTPGRPRFLRFADWRAIPDLRRVAWWDFGLTTATLLLFTGTFFAARSLRPDLSQMPVLPMDGGEAHRLLAAEARWMVLAARAPLILAGTAVGLFLVIAWRGARRLWEGFHAEQRRRLGEANTLTVNKL